MNSQEKIVDLKKTLDAIYATMPETFFEQQQRDKSAFLITKEIERLENPKSYRENVRFWEDHEIRL